MQNKRKLVFSAGAMAILLLPCVAHAQWDTGFGTTSASGQLGELTGQNIQFPHPYAGPPPMSMGGLNSVARPPTPMGGLNMGNAVGGMVAGMALNWLLSSDEPAGLTPEAQAQENARQAALEQQRLEQERQARISNAATMRADWDNRDQELSSTLDGVFSVPVPQSTAFFGIPDNPDPDAVAQALMDDSQDAAPGDTSVVNLSDIPTPAVSDNLFQQGVVRAQQTPSYADNSQPYSPPQPPSAQRDPFINWGVQTEKNLLRQIGDQLTAQGKAEATRQLEEYLVEHCPAYVFAKDMVTNIPGYSTAIQVYDSLNSLRKEFQELNGLMGGQVSQDLQMFEESATQTVASLASPTLNDAGLPNRVFDGIEQREDESQQAYSSEAWSQAKQGFSHAREQDEKMVNASVGPENTNVVPVNGPTGHYINLNRWLNQPNANLNEAGYGF